MSIFTTYQSAFIFKGSESSPTIIFASIIYSVLSMLSANVLPLISSILGIIFMSFEKVIKTRPVSEIEFKDAVGGVGGSTGIYGIPFS